MLLILFGYGGVILGPKLRVTKVTKYFEVRTFLHFDSCCCES